MGNIIQYYIRFLLRHFSQILVLRLILGEQVSHAICDFELARPETVIATEFVKAINSSNGEFIKSLQCFNLNQS